MEEEGGSGLESCKGTVPSGQLIDTASPGAKTFTVTTSDRLGNTRSLTHTYSVEDRTAPLIALSSPFDGAVFKLDQHVPASYTCSDEVGGSGLVSCVGNVPNGAVVIS